MRLPLVAAGGWCRTTASDARSLYYNAEWISALSIAQVQFVLAHEALHCALGHFARRGHRVKRLWDLACDFAVNPLLVAEGLAPPAEAVVLDLYAGMAAEEIYPCLDDTLDEETLDDHQWDGEADDGGGQGASGNDAAQGQGGGGKQEQNPDAGGATPKAPQGASGESADAPPSSPSPLTGREREQLDQQWRRHLAAAAQRAREAGKLSGQMARLVDDALAPQVSWRALLAQYLSQIAREDYSYQRPHRRGGGSGEAILPSLRSRAGDLVVALDISGSVSDEDLAQFVGEINAIKGALPVRITLLACDAALAPDGPWHFEPWQTLTLPRKFVGGGGTDFAPVFDWVKKEGLRPDVLIYFTDADGGFPGHAPDYPVIWLVKGGKPVPWGRRVPLS